MQALVIDDSRAVRLLVGKILREQGFEVHEAGHGQQGLEQLQLNPEIRLFRFAGFLLTGGIVIFSGSLYAYSLTGIQTWALITPLGGLCFMLGWAVFLVGATKIRAE